MTLFIGNRLAKINEDGTLVTGELAHIFEIVELGSLQQRGPDGEWIAPLQIAKLKEIE